MATAKIEKLINVIEATGRKTHVTLESSDEINIEVDDGCGEELDHTLLTCDKNGKLINICFFTEYNADETNIETKADLDSVIKMLQLYRKYWAEWN